MGGQRGQHRLPGTPACQRSQKAAQPGGPQKGEPHPPDEALGRSRGGLTSKLHLCCDGKGRPLSVLVTAGQRHESTKLRDVLDAIRVTRRDGLPGRPRSRPDLLLADKGYSFPHCRELLRARGIPHVIPEKRDQKQRRESRPGRKPNFDREAYRRRNLVERCVNKLKEWRGVATRYEKKACNYRAAVIVASLVTWLAS